MAAPRPQCSIINTAGGGICACAHGILGPHDKNLSDSKCLLLKAPQAAENVRALMESLPPMRPLVMVLKVFLQQRELNEVGCVSPFLAALRETCCVAERFLPRLPVNVRAMACNIQQTLHQSLQVSCPWLLLTAFPSAGLLWRHGLLRPPSDGGRLFAAAPHAAPARCGRPALWQQRQAAGIQALWVRCSRAAGAWLFELLGNA